MARAGFYKRNLTLINNYKLSSNNMIELEKHSWLQSCKSFSIESDVLTAYLYDTKGGVKYNKIVLSSLFKDVHLENNDGYLKYKPSEEQDVEIMNAIFPVYKEETIPEIKVKECIMLSIDNDKYNKSRNETLSVLNEYKLPNISVHFGYSWKNVNNSPFYKFMDGPRCELTCGMLEIFEKFASTSNNEWLLFFEDDVRPVNISKEEDLTVLYNVPVDAELIRPYIGENTKCKLKDLKYKKSFGGAYNHAFYISTSGCQKVINYTKKHKWKSYADIDLCKMGKYQVGFPTGYDAWSFTQSEGQLNVPNMEEEEKLNIYHCSHVFFNQTSMPCVPFK